MLQGGSTKNFLQGVGGQHNMGTNRPIFLVKKSEAPSIFIFYMSVFFKKLIVDSSSVGKC